MDETVPRTEKQGQNMYGNTNPLHCTNIVVPPRMKKLTLRYLDKLYINTTVRIGTTIIEYIVYKNETKLHLKPCTKKHFTYSHSFFWSTPLQGFNDTETKSNRIHC